MGSSQLPSTSGLHHDFHDNLYILLRGEKTFHLYNSNEHENMYTVGKIVQVHPNGRVNYEGQLTFADGSDVQALNAYQAWKRVEEAAAKLDGDKDDELENEIDAALDDALDAEIDEDDDEEDDESDLDNDVSDKESENKVKRQRTTSSSNPPNFSRVDTSMSDEAIAVNFPRFLEARSRRFEVHLKAGDMLYLPAGWFHEVFSMNLSGEGHMAFNYWFHPPDNDSFDRPYTSDFWFNDWKERNMT